MDEKTALRLSRLVCASGYRNFYLAFGDGNQSDRKWERSSRNLADPLRGLVELFLLMRPIDPDRAAALLGADLRDALIAEGILVRGPDTVRTAGLVLISFRSLLFFHEFVQRPEIYFGRDSIALGLYQNPAYHGTTLDLCSGTSIQAMISAQHGNRAVAVEINPRAARVAAVNLAMNALRDKVQLVNRSLEDFAAETDERFDLITFNPPLLPIPEAIDYPFVGDGGPDALDVTRRTLRLYAPRLADGGAIEFIGCGMGRGRSPVFVAELASILAEYNAHSHVQLLSRYDMRRGVVFYDALIETAAVNSLLSVELADAVFDRHFRDLGYDELYTFFMRGERVPGGNGRAPTVTDLTEVGDCWFVT